MPSPQVKFETPEDGNESEPDDEEESPPTPPAGADGGDVGSGDGEPIPPSGGDDDGGSILGINRSVVIGLLIAAALLWIYLAYIRDSAGSGGADGGVAIPTREEAEAEPEPAEAEVDGGQAQGQPQGYNLTKDPTDPLKFDQQLINNTDIFPSLSKRGE